MIAESGSPPEGGLLALERALTNEEAAGAVDIRAALESATDALNRKFVAGAGVVPLVRERAGLVDCVLKHLWSKHFADVGPSYALIAVGGYGRGELHPHSDVDVLILTDGSVSPAGDEAIATFLASLWDAGLEIGHSVRSVAQCCEQARADLTVATTLMETRLLQGSTALFAAMVEETRASEIWPAKQFFSAKLEEQRARHLRYEDTAYQLEPNVKGSPGGLRDIQMIAWITQRHFGSSTLDELVIHGFLTKGQLKLLHAGREFLWRVRFGLHVLTGRREDRLLFDYQTKLAELLGYEDANYTLAVEQMMQRYYRTVMELSRLNEMLLQLFEEAILMDADARPQILNTRFEIKNGFLQTRSATVFAEEPPALLELFLLLQQNDIRGVSAKTIGLLRRSLHLIDDEFRQNPRNHKLFLSILRASAGVTHELRRMNLYGVLGRYIPAFGRIVGRMQYDLFHAYTVDQHTLFVVSNLRRFALTRFDHEHPHCSPLMQSFEKPEIAYLAGLFHDIAKGRGGDHSELGAIDAETFCLSQGMSAYDARTVAWLVRNHLILSMTAQKKDIGDPAVINEFAALVRDKTHLDYLYVLTVADVKATNPRLWNSWKASLFRDLYEQTDRALRRGLQRPIDRDLLIGETKSEAREILGVSGMPESDVDEVWKLLNADYFLRYRGSEIAWHTRFLGGNIDKLDGGLMDIRLQEDGDGIEAVIYTPRTHPTFALTTAVLAELGMNIVDVRLVPLESGFSIDTYVFLELDSRVDVDATRLTRIRDALRTVLDSDQARTAAVTRPTSRQARNFSTPTRISFVADPANARTVLELVTGDRPGLLSTVGQIFIESRIDIEAAKILTIGEKAEDVFYISTVDFKPLDDEACRELHEQLMNALLTDQEYQ